MKKSSIVFGLGALTVGVLVVLYLLSIGKQIPLTPISDDMDMRGKQLRAAIDQEYKKRTEAHTLRALDPPSEDLTPLVAEYIPVGISFDDAERILRSAGFKIKARPGLNPPPTWKGDTTRYDEVAEINPYVPGYFFSRSISIGVYLTPEAPGKYTKVSKTEAQFLFASL